MVCYVKMMILMFMGGLSFVVRAEELLSFWTPQYRYQTQINYVIAVSNGTLSAKDVDGNKPYRNTGKFAFKGLVFQPTIRFTTDKVTKDGNNYYARRTYEIAKNFCDGGDDIKWVSNYKWNVLERGRRWFQRFKDDDLKALDIFRENSEKAKKKGTGVEEIFPIFGWGKDMAYFDEQKDALFLKWSDRTVKNILLELTDNDDLEIRLAPKATPILSTNERGSADRTIREMIASEFKLSAASICGSTKGIERKRKSWTIDAQCLHGLLASQSLKQLIKFRGTIELRMREVNIKEQKRRKIFSDVFDAVCLEAVSSKDVQVGFDTREGGMYDLFDVSIGMERENEGHLEFWFDRSNEVLKYAQIRIHKDAYRGTLPNPQLGEMISKLHGVVDGSLDFVCEYTTNVSKVFQLSEDEKK